MSCCSPVAFSVSCLKSFACSKPKDYVIPRLFDLLPTIDDDSLVHCVAFLTPAPCFGQHFQAVSDFSQWLSLFYTFPVNIISTTCLSFHLPYTDSHLLLGLNPAFQLKVSQRVCILVFETLWSSDSCICSGNLLWLD